MKKIIVLLVIITSLLMCGCESDSDETFSHTNHREQPKDKTAYAEWQIVYPDTTITYKGQVRFNTQQPGSDPMTQPFYMTISTNNYGVNRLWIWSDNAYVGKRPLSLDGYPTENNCPMRLLNYKF